MGEIILGWCDIGRLHDMKPILDLNEKYQPYHLVGDVH